MPKQNSITAVQNVGYIFNIPVFLPYQKKKDILLHSFWIPKNMHWSRNHSLINTAVHSVMEAAHYFSYMKPVHCTIYVHPLELWQIFQLTLLNGIPEVSPKNNLIKLLGNTIIVQALQGFLIAQTTIKTSFSDTREGKEMN